jgi:hypothetical protein
MSIFITIASALGGLLVLVAGFYKWYTTNQASNEVVTHVKASEDLADDKQIKETANAKDHAANTNAVDLLNELHASSSTRPQGTHRTL